MRQRPKQASYVEKSVARQQQPPAAEVYNKAGHRVRDPSPILNVRGGNKPSAAAAAPSSSGSSAIVRQYKSLDDIPDGVPVSPKWGTTWVPRSVAVSPRPGVEDELESDDNYWTTTVSSSARKANYSQPPVHQQQLNYRNDDDFNDDNDYRGDVSPRGDRSASHRVIPRQQLRPMPSEEDDYYRSGRGDYDDEYDAAPARRAPAAANSAKKASHYSPPRRATPGNAGSYSHRRHPDDDEDDGWDEDSIPGNRDTPPHFGTSDAYDSYGNDEDYPYGSARGHKKESSGYGARLPPSYPVPQDKVSGSGRPAMKIDKEAPPLPVEMKYAPPPPNRDDAPPKEKLYFSRQPRNVEYKPYSLAEWRAKKPNDYVEIKPTLQPDLNSEVLQAKRANQERVKEFSKNLLTFNQQVLRQQRKLPRSSESNDIERADQRAVSKRERAKQFAQNIPKPKPAASSVAMPSMAGGSYRAGSRFRATDDEEDWAGKDGLDHDYMGRVAQRDSSAIGGISDVEFRRIELLEQKHNDASRQIAAIKKSLGV